MKYLANIQVSLVRMGTGAAQAWRDRWRQRTQWVMIWLSLLVPVSAVAQAITPEATDTSRWKDVAPSERVRRDADGVYRWIKLHSNTPRKILDPKVVDPQAGARVELAARSAPASGARGISAAANSVTALQAPQQAEVATASASPENLPSTTLAEQGAREVIHTPSAFEEVALSPIVQTRPEFPSSVVASIGSGKVSVQFTVEKDGSVSAPQVLASSDRRLNRAALKAVTQWRFEPIEAARVAQVELGFTQD